MEYISSYGAKDIAPNTICFNAVIDAYARSKGIDNKAVKAELILERMTEESNKGNKVIRPDTITFNTVINAAARSFGDPSVRKEAYFIGLNSFKTLHRLDYCQPSSITYVLFLRLLENLVDSKDSRDYMAEKVFKLCVRQKLVNDAVVSQLKRTCSPMAARHILSSFVVDADNKNKKQR